MLVIDLVYSLRDRCDEMLMTVTITAYYLLFVEILISHPEM